MAQSWIAANEEFVEIDFVETRFIAYLNIKKEASFLSFFNILGVEKGVVLRW
jgi:hypothetical protein